MMHFLPRAARTLALAATLAGAGLGAHAETFTHGNFQAAPVFRPAGPVRNVVLLLSGPDGWSANNARLAKSLADEGALVAGVDVPRLYKALVNPVGGCFDPYGDIDNFSHMLQARYQIPGYLQPILVGAGSAGAMAYTLLAMAPAGTYSGAISLGFRPEVTLPPQFCKVPNLPLEPAAKPRAYGVKPVAHLGRPWLVFPDASGRYGDADDTRAFATKVADARLMAPANLADGATEVPELAQAFAQLAPHQVGTAAPPAAVKDLPIVESPATAPATGRNAEVLALMVSGDGGWAGIDKDLAAALNRAGIPVIGFDSLRYFWKAKTPAGTATDLSRTLGYYLAQPQWKRPQVLLIGYSQGADVLPFAVNRFAPELRARIASVMLLGLGEKASFEFHVANWIKSDDSGLPIAPEVRRMPAGLPICVYGTDDKDTVCPSLASGTPPIRTLALKGDHHFGGDYDRLAAAILSALHR